jgi:putative aldouronate transport system substrate-binding protein
MGTTPVRELSLVSRSRLTRRGFVARLCGTAVAGAFGAPLLAACTSGSPAPSRGQTAPGSGGASSSSGPVQLPSYIPVTQGPKPDLAGSAEGIDAAFFALPKDLFKAVPQTPAVGGEISVQTWTQTPPPPPIEQNSFWQELNKRVGATLKINIVPQSDYQAKLATTLAGGDLPDILYINTRNLEGLPQFLRAQAADLTPHLSGDAVKDYPNLANLPTSTWRGMVFNNAIYGIPVPINPFDWVLFVHQELLDQDGLSHPRTATEFKELMGALTRPQQNQWGINTEGGVGSALGMMSGLYPAMFGAPLNWSVDAAGKLTKNFETEQYKQALSFAREIYAAGYVSPKALELSNTSGKQELYSRTTATRWDGFRTYSLVWPQGQNLVPKPAIRTIHPFSHDGTSRPMYYLSPGHRGFSIIKKASEERVKELLRVFNYIAAPFGSEEWYFQRYGLKDVHHTLDANGNPEQTQKGETEINVPLGWITQPAPTLTGVQFGAEYAQLLHSDEAAHLPYGIQDPTDSLYSAVNGAKTPALNQKIADGMIAMIAGRQPMSDWEPLVKEWRSSGGDEVRADLEKAYAAAKG